MKRPAAAPYTKEIATMIAVVVSNKEATSRSERGAMGLGVDDLEVEVDDLEVVEEGVVRLLDVVDIFVCRSTYCFVFWCLITPRATEAGVVNQNKINIF